MKRWVYWPSLFLGMLFLMKNISAILCGFKDLLLVGAFRLRGSR